MKMRFPLIAALAVVVSLAACGDMPTAYAPEDASFKNGVATQVDVTAGLTIEVGSGESYYVGTEEGVPAPGGNGTCHLTIEQGGSVAGQPGRWHNGNNFAGPGQNANCLVNGDGMIDLVVTFEVPARHVQPRSGNEHLNFEDLIVYDEDESGENVVIVSTSKRWIHYQNNHKVTNGFGVLYGTDSQGGEWTIDLAQISESGNWFAGELPLTLVANNETYGDRPAVLSW